MEKEREYSKLQQYFSLFLKKIRINTFQRIQCDALNFNSQHTLGDTIIFLISEYF